jgi:hypothetical protein
VCAAQGAIRCAKLGFVSPLMVSNKNLPFTCLPARGCLGKCCKARRQNDWTTSAFSPIATAERTWREVSRGPKATVSNCSKRSTTALASSRRIEIVVMVPSIQNPDNYGLEALSRHMAYSRLGRRQPPRVVPILLRSEHDERGEQLGDDDQYYVFNGGTLACYAMRCCPDRTDVNCVSAVSGLLDVGPAG